MTPYQEMVRLARAQAKAECSTALDAVRRVLERGELPALELTAVRAIAAQLDTVIRKLDVHLNEPDPRHGPSGPPVLPPRP